MLPPSHQFQHLIIIGREGYGRENKSDLQVVKLGLFLRCRYAIFTLFGSSVSLSLNFAVHVLHQLLQQPQQLPSVAIPATYGNANLDLKCSRTLEEFT